VTPSARRRWGSNVFVRSDEPEPGRHRLNVSRQTVNALETGRYDPSLPLAFAIAKLFKLRIEDVFTT